MAAAQIEGEIIMSNNLRLKDKTVIITGAGGGIGRETAVLMASEGAKIVIADVDIAGCEETLALLEKTGGEGFIAELDVTDREQSRQVVRDTLERYGRVDVLINNAGITQDALLAKMTEVQWDTVISVNLKGPFNCTQAVIETMVEQGQGVILNAASVVALFGNIGQVNCA